MAGRVEGKVAFVTGAGRGQGRSHAVGLAEEGADIIAVDICQDYDTVAYGLATEADLAETVKEVEALDRRIIATRADVRDAAALKEAVDRGVAELGRLDIVCANAGGMAGTMPPQHLARLSPQQAGGGGHRVGVVPVPVDQHQAGEGIGRRTAQP
jgi:NAD(P)-dependent dehydrogenase (short-subunit alcohol dehydrogenase family)